VCSRGGTFSQNNPYRDDFFVKTQATQFVDTDSDVTNMHTKILTLPWETTNGGTYFNWGQLTLSQDKCAVTIAGLDTPISGKTGGIASLSFGGGYVVSVARVGGRGWKNYVFDHWMPTDSGMVFSSMATTSYTFQGAASLSASSLSKIPTSAALSGYITGGTNFFSRVYVSTSETAGSTCNTPGGCTMSSGATSSLYGRCWYPMMVETDESFAATFTGAISGTTLTVSGLTCTNGGSCNALGVGVYVLGYGVAANTIIQSGAHPTWTVSITQTVSARKMMGATLMQPGGSGGACGSHSNFEAVDPFNTDGTAGQCYISTSQWTDVLSRYAQVRKASTNALFQWPSTAVSQANTGDLTFNPSVRIANYGANSYFPSTMGTGASATSASKLANCAGSMGGATNTLGSGTFVYWAETGEASGAAVVRSAYSGSSFSAGVPMWRGSAIASFMAGATTLTGASVSNDVVGVAHYGSASGVAGATILFAATTDALYATSTPTASAGIVWFRLTSSPTLSFVGGGGAPTSSGASPWRPQRACRPRRGSLSGSGSCSRGATAQRRRRH